MLVLSLTKSHPSHSPNMPPKCRNDRLRHSSSSSLHPAKVCGPVCCSCPLHLLLQPCDALLPSRFFLGATFATNSDLTPNDSVLCANNWACPASTFSCPPACPPAKKPCSARPAMHIRCFQRFWRRWRWEWLGRRLATELTEIAKSVKVVHWHSMWNTDLGCIHPRKDWYGHWEIVLSVVLSRTRRSLRLQARVCCHRNA